VRQMMYQSIDNRYRSLTDGLQDIPQMMFDYGLLLGHSDIIATLVIGAILVGILGESVARRWS
ncbi:MAG: TrgA family protein, partial [Cognatishimia sp.]|uniref:TrgA family protein n=1 Tax=Cognatishimia sp. TaxID=2211648 RepID=UPI00405999B8